MRHMIERMRTSCAKRLGSTACAEISKGMARWTESMYDSNTTREIFETGGQAAPLQEKLNAAGAFCADFCRFIFAEPGEADREDGLARSQPGSAAEEGCRAAYFILAKERDWWMELLVAAHRRPGAALPAGGYFKKT